MIYAVIDTNVLVSAGSPRVECLCYRTPFGYFSESDGAVYQWEEECQ